jgi:hypothetical protein
MVGCPLSGRQNDLTIAKTLYSRFAHRYCMFLLVKRPRPPYSGCNGKVRAASKRREGKMQTQSVGRPCQCCLVVHTAHAHQRQHDRKPIFTTLSSRCWLLTMNTHEMPLMSPPFSIIHFSRFVQTGSAPRASIAATRGSVDVCPIYLHQTERWHGVSAKQ